jgi:hypothetical protein
VNVHQQDMGGFVRVFTDPLSAVPDELHVWLSHALTEWFRQRPQLRMRCVLAVTRGGDTGELHAWYDLHVFPRRVQPETRRAGVEQIPAFATTARPRASSSLT